MKHTAFLFVLLLAACAKKPTGPTPGDIARQAAESYYALLAQGQCEKYVAAIYDADSMSGDYRKGMVEVVQQFVEEQKQQRGGIVKATAIGDTLYGRQADIRLEVLYGDKTKEHVLVPLVKVGETWKLQ